MSLTLQYGFAELITPLCTVVKTAQRENEDAVKKDDLRKMFQADERDNLVLNESTRLNIEKLYALNTQDELESKLQMLSRPDCLPQHIANWSIK